MRWYALVNLNLCLESIMKKRPFYLALIFVVSSSLHAYEGTDATTEDGQNVILYSNGTWAFKLDSAPIKPKVIKKTQSIKKPNIIKTATPKIKETSLVGKKGVYQITYNDKLWKKTKGGNNDAEIQLEYKGGNGYAMLIFDRTPVSLEKLKKQAIKNMRAVASKVEIIAEEKKKIKGHQVMQLKINSHIEEVPFAYLNHYVTGKWGTVQFVTYTATTLMPDYEADFLKLLNGLRIKK